MPEAAVGGREGEAVRKLIYRVLCHHIHYCTETVIRDKKMKPHSQSHQAVSPFYIPLRKCKEITRMIFEEQTYNLPSSTRLRAAIGRAVNYNSIEIRHPQVSEPLLRLAFTRSNNVVIPGPIYGDVPLIPVVLSIPGKERPEEYLPRRIPLLLYPLGIN